MLPQKSLVTLFQTQMIDMANLGRERVEAYYARPLG
jgi:hypothetical protein